MREEIDREYSVQLLVRQAESGRLFHRGLRRTSAMRLQIGDIPCPTASSPEADGWTRVTGPSGPSVQLIAWFIGIATLTGLLALIVTTSLAVPLPSRQPDVQEPTPWVAVVLTLVLAVPVHELMHAIFHPDGGLSSATIFVIWPRKLRFGVYFEGYMSRRRWLIMRLAPLIILSIVPTGLLAATAGLPRSFIVETVLSLFLLVNALGSGGDVLAAAWVISNIPRESTMAFLGGKAYWRSGSFTPA